MNIDIETEHVRMRPEWHRAIDEWVVRCQRQHPQVAGIDVMLRHGAESRAGEEVTVDATAPGRRLRGTARAPMMGVALHDAFEAIERELMVHEAVARRV
jgi:ribosome-associated translation inhibitor RaiA